MYDSIERRLARTRTESEPTSSSNGPRESAYASRREGFDLYSGPYDSERAIISPGREPQSDIETYLRGSASKRAHAHAGAGMQRTAAPAPAPAAAAATVVEPCAQTTLPVAVAVAGLLGPGLAASPVQMRSLDLEPAILIDPERTPTVTVRGRKRPGPEGGPAYVHVAEAPRAPLEPLAAFDTPLVGRPGSGQGPADTGPPFSHAMIVPAAPAPAVSVIGVRCMDVDVDTRAISLSILVDAPAQNSGRVSEHFDPPPLPTQIAPTQAEPEGNAGSGLPSTLPVGIVAHEAKAAQLKISMGSPSPAHALPLMTSADLGVGLGLALAGPSLDPFDHHGHGPGPAESEAAPTRTRLGTQGPDPMQSPMRLASPSPAAPAFDLNGRGLGFGAYAYAEPRTAAPVTAGRRDDRCETEPLDLAPGLDVGMARGGGFGPQFGGEHGFEFAGGGAGMEMAGRMPLGVPEPTRARRAPSVSFYELEAGDAFAADVFAPVHAHAPARKPQPPAAQYPAESQGMLLSTGTAGLGVSRTPGPGSPSPTPLGLGTGVEHSEELELEGGTQVVDPGAMMVD